MPPVRIGLLGAGEMGAVHAAAHARIDGVEIAAVVGRRPERARALADRLGVPAFTDPAAVLDDPSIDAVDVTVPTALHRELVVAALERGKHVFCETPLAASVADAEAMIAAAAASGRVLQVALLMRVAETSVRMRDLVSSGTLGRPLAVSTSRLWPGLVRPADDHHGDALDELALFDFDLLVWTFGMPVAVSAAGSPRAGAIDHVLAVLHFPGFDAFVEASRVLPPSFPFRIDGRVVCERGTAEWGVRFPAGRPPSVWFTRYPVDGPSERSEAFETNPYDVECRRFVDVIRGEAGADLLGAPAALDGLRLVAASRRALAGGGAVRLDAPS